MPKARSKPARYDRLTSNGSVTITNAASRNLSAVKPSHHISIVMNSGSANNSAPTNARAKPRAYAVFPCIKTITTRWRVKFQR